MIGTDVLSVVMSQSQRLVFTGAQPTFADSAECCYETTSVLEIIITKERGKLLRVCPLQQPAEPHSLKDRILLNLVKMLDLVTQLLWQKWVKIFYFLQVISTLYLKAI